MKLLVLDGNSIVNRAFYGIKLLTTKDGRYTNALVGLSLIHISWPQSLHTKVLSSNIMGISIH